jgi:integrase
MPHLVQRSRERSQSCPHVVRHTAATWLMQAGIGAFEAACYLGMSVETLLEVK